MKLNLSHFEVLFVTKLFLVGAFGQNPPLKFMEREFSEKILHIYIAFHNKISDQSVVYKITNLSNFQTTSSAKSK